MVQMSFTTHSYLVSRHFRNLYLWN